MKSTSRYLLAGMAAAALTATCQAIVITPFSGVLNTNRWEGVTGPGMPEITASLNLIVPGIGSNLLYKQDAGGGEEGSFASSYATSYNSVSDPSAGSLTYTGGPSIGPNAYMLVKDGNHVPIWYFYNLTSLAWNGTATIDFSGFWPNGGAISHVSLYGGPANGGEPPNRVPDGGSTLILLGSAFLASASLNRYLKRKK